MTNTSKRSVSDTLDFTLMAVGFWMLFSPAVLHFNSDKPENWISVVAGFIVIAFAFAVRRAYRDWELWTMAVIGAVVAVLPWIAGFNPATKAEMNTVICGIVIVAAAIGRWYVQGHGVGADPTVA